MMLMLLTTLLLLASAGPTAAQAKRMNYVSFENEPLAGKQGATISFEELMITPGPDLPSPSVGGNCIGSGCGSAQTRKPGGPTGGSTQGGNQGVSLNERQDQDFRDFVMSSRPSIFASEPLLRSSAPTLNPQVMLNQLSPLYDRELYLPYALLKDIEITFEGIGKELNESDSQLGSLVIDFAPLPTVVEFNEAALKGVTYHKSSQILVDDVLQKARDRLISQHQQAVTDLRSRLDKQYVVIADALRSKRNNSETSQKNFANDMAATRTWMAIPSTNSRDIRHVLGGQNLRFDAVAVARSELPSGVYHFQRFFPEPLKRATDEVPVELGAADSAFKQDLTNILERARGTSPDSPQGILTKFLIEYLVIEADQTYYLDPDRARQLRDDCKAILDFLTGAMPLVGVPRDLFEAYLGEDLLNGQPLSVEDRALSTIFVASGGIARVVPKEMLRPLVGRVLKLGRNFTPTQRRSYESTTTLLQEMAERWPQSIDKLRRARMGIKTFDPKKVDKAGANSFSVGKVSRLEMDVLGRAWVGADATVRYSARDGKLIYESRNGLRQYRPPEWKENERMTRANLKERTRSDDGTFPTGPWLSNAHFDVE